ncbi:putative transferase CAF17 homolog, mitochondrial [Oppia nitens]|uniref:putative transferase CAF17 homolog, mitochondrial n=1 Tax=Oppia nitens TaxID=1686743 RepID=UPI0023DC06C2|nr:putative transferase CAF17 homolog, mitochondrial [Oppia nitens]
MQSIVTAMSSISMLKTFNRLLTLKPISWTTSRSISYLLTKLNNRQLIDVNGNDSYDYIQGLITNDMRHLRSSLETSVTQDCIYAFMLNRTGRVIADVFVYKNDHKKDEKNSLFIETDSQLLESTEKYLRSYRIRRKVDININSHYNVWSLFPSVNQFDDQIITELNECEINFKSENCEDFLVVRDPRLKQLGFRLLVKYYENESEDKVRDRVKKFLQSKSLDINETNAKNYDKYRYRLGVGEGVQDFPIELCFPLECNGDFLHAISFQKGCYVGQELTARIYHTGVIRKRLMPIEIIDGKEVIENISIQNITANIGNESKNVGKFRSHCSTNGLALLRVDDCLKTDNLFLTKSELTIKCFKPFWWPKEMNKQSISNAKN